MLTVQSTRCPEGIASRRGTKVDESRGEEIPLLRLCVLIQDDDEVGLDVTLESGRTRLSIIGKSLVTRCTTGDTRDGDLSEQ